jgi:hypothetical protein
MRRTLTTMAALLAATTTIGCTRQQRAQVTTFQADSPAVYVAKVKNLLVGLPPSDDEVQAVTRDPSRLRALIDQWMTQPEYQQKMLTFFELAFQQTQLTLADFNDMFPPHGIAVGKWTPLLLQNVRESFARTVLALVASGRPLTDAFTTHQLMMTPALMELYAFMDARRLDDSGKISDDFATAHPTLKIYLEAAAGPIALTDTLDAQGPNFMHWYDVDIGKLTVPDPSCNSDPIVLTANGYGLHTLLYGGVLEHVSATGYHCPLVTGTAAGAQLGATDFSSWKMVTLRAPNAGESTTRFYDLPTLRAANELVLMTPHAGFFSTPAFFANWPTNQSNQMRVTLNQALIVATGAAIDGNDGTHPASTPGLDAAHATPGSACYDCHSLLDPSRAILSSTWSYFYFAQNDPVMIKQKGLFAFGGVVAPVAGLDDFAATLATHPKVAAAWTQKLCYYLNSQACAEDDPELQRIVAVFKSSGLSWTTLVRELSSSPLTTHAAATATGYESGEVVAVARRDHLCAALNNRLGLSDVCGLDASRAPMTAVPTIVGGLPSDGYGRGATVPVLPNQPTLFYRAGLENICAAVANLVIDAKPSATNAMAKHWSSQQPDPAIADFVSTLMALTPSDRRAAPAQSLLQSHFHQAMQSGASASDALKSTFVTACLAPSAIGIGM